MRLSGGDRGFVHRLGKSERGDGVAQGWQRLTPCSGTVKPCQRILVGSVRRDDWWKLQSFERGVPAARTRPLYLGGALSGGATVASPGSDQATLDPHDRRCVHCAEVHLDTRPDA